MREEWGNRSNDLWHPLWMFGELERDGTAYLAATMHLLFVNFAITVFNTHIQPKRDDISCSPLGDLLCSSEGGAFALVTSSKSVSQNIQIYYYILI